MAPDTLTHVPLDFERQSLAAELSGAGFDLEISHIAGAALPSLQPVEIDLLFASTFPSPDEGQREANRPSSEEQTTPVHWARHVLKTGAPSLTGTDLLVGFLELDQGTLEMEIQQFLESLKNLGRQLAGSPLGMGLYFWIIATTTAFAVFEIGSRRGSVTGQQGGTVVCEGATSTWLPGFPTS